MKTTLLSMEEEMLKILEENLVGDKEIYAAMIARRSLDEIRPLPKKLKKNSEVARLYEVVKYNFDGMFDTIPAYYEWGIDSINFKLGKYNVLYYILPPYDLPPYYITLVAITPLNADLNRIGKKMDAARRRIIYLLETKRIRSKKLLK